MESTSDANRYVVMEIIVTTRQHAMNFLLLSPDSQNSSKTNLTTALESVKTSNEVIKKTKNNAVCSRDLPQNLTGFVKKKKSVWQFMCNPDDRQTNTPKI